MKVTNATILLFPFFLFACNNKNNLENEVRLFAGQTISIEKDSLFNPYYSHNNIHSSTPYTYVIYSDADNCSECTINHIDDWSDLDMEKYVQKGLLSYMFILAPEKSQLSRIKKLCVVIKVLKSVNHTILSKIQHTFTRCYSINSIVDFPLRMLA